MFTLLSRSNTLKRLASAYGMATPRSFARRFIAGEQIDDAIAAARALQAKGLLLTLDYLGESVTTTDQANVGDTRVHPPDRRHRRVQHRAQRLAEAVPARPGDRPATCVDNMRRILEPARQHEFFVRIDMESSAYTEVTLEVFETLWNLEYRNIGVVLQSYLYRTERDLRRMNEIGARVRLVKGAYKEPAAVAYQQKADVDAAYLRQMRLLLDHGSYPAFATHDVAILNEIKIVRSRTPGSRADKYEFQMLYGVRRDLQSSFVADGYRMRVYIPFGREWFPYFMRRLGERPANVGFVIRALLD